MIIDGGIYTFEQVIQIVIDIDDDMIVTYQLPITNINTKDEIEREMQEELINHIDKNKIYTYYDQSFIDFYDGYLGQINEELLHAFKIFHFWNMN